MWLYCMMERKRAETDHPSIQKPLIILRSSFSYWITHCTYRCNALCNVYNTKLIHEGLQYPLICILEKKTMTSTPRHILIIILAYLALIYFLPPSFIALAHSPHMWGPTRAVCRMGIKQMYQLELENITPLGLHLPPAYSREFVCVLLPHIIYSISSTPTLQHPRLTLSSLWAAG